MKIIISFLFVTFKLSDMASAQSITENKMVVEKDTISYYDNIKGARTLFFIHGSFINKEYWKDQLEYFAAGYRVIAIDLMGHGKSTHNRDAYTINEYATDIVTVLNHLHLEKVIVVGHSIGADIMLSVNEKIPKQIDGLIGIDYFKNAGAQLPEPVIDQLMTNLKTDFSNTSESYARQALLSDKTDPVIVQRIVHDFRTIDKKVGISMNGDFFHFPKQEEILLTKLDKKLYLINMDYQLTNENLLAKYLKTNYELKSIGGTCHFPMIEHPDEVNKAIEKILKQITDRK